MRIFFSFILLGIAAHGTAQTPKWTTLPMPPAAVRYDDCFFITPEIGWAIHPYNPFTVTGTDTITYQGRIWKTTDGGNSWTLQLDSCHMYLRAVGFADSLHGWATSLGWNSVPDSLYNYYDSIYHHLDTTLMIETSDGGRTWQRADNKIVGTKPAGICGMHVLNDTLAYGVGRYTGPAYMLKTTNGGKTWKSIDMNSLASYLIDCHFWSPDSGIVVGGSVMVDSLVSPLILFTSDGGDHWVTRYHGSGWHSDEWCWKISFPRSDLGYVSVETFSRTGYLLKTIDHGVTWKKITVTGSADLQGVGFLNDSVGWTGGWDTINTGYVTTNGGKSWKVAGIGKNLNRFHFFGDTLAYASGQSIFKMTVEKTNYVEPRFSGTSFLLYPNPASDKMKLTFQGEMPYVYSMIITDILGREVLKNVSFNKDISVQALSPGIYNASVRADKENFSIPFVVTR
jgi:photosystem II stability/assembly factor-like uncharacterized protein